MWHKYPRRIAALGSALAVLGAGIAAAQTFETEVPFGNLLATLGVEFSPTTLPRDEFAPVVAGGFLKLRTKDGTVPPPLSHFRIEVDKDTGIETRGLPVCQPARLRATTVAQARRACPAAIFGTGTGSAVIVFPEQPPIRTSSPVTFFNGPRVDGDPTVIVHAHLTVPVPATYLIRARIKRLGKGPMGYRIESSVPKIAGGAGSVVSFHFKIDRRWTFKGRRLSYVSGRCSHPGPHPAARLQEEFVDGTKVDGTISATCRVR